MSNSKFSSRRVGLAGGLMVAVLTGLIVGMTPSTSRAEIDADAVKKARTFLETREVGQLICSSLHFGSQYKGRRADTDTMVHGVKEEGQLSPDEFALVYTICWGQDDDGRTDVAFFFDADGTLNNVKALSTNAGVFNQPFDLANLAIQAVGSILLEAYQDKMSNDQRRMAQEIINAADARKLLVFTLKLRQNLQ